MANNMLIPLPNGLSERVVIDLANRHIYVERRVAGDPKFLTWYGRNKSSGLKFNVVPVEMDFIASLKATGMMAETPFKDVDLEVRNRAIEIINEAARYRASDIHFMKRGAFTEIQIVVKGGLRMLETLTQDEGDAITRAIYQGVAQTRDASYNPLEDQNAQIPGEELMNPEVSAARVVCGPAYPVANGGGFMSIRLQYVGGKPSSNQTKLKPLKPPKTPAGKFLLKSMGFNDRQVEKIRTLMSTPNGLVIVTGPTGSGKTTTMFEASQESARDKPHRRWVTIEDPVENHMPWAVQLVITGVRGDKETGSAYAEKLRVALRMAPDAILLGELRGPEVASAALEAAITGHQVWTTMHVSDPFLFVDRLESMNRTQLNRQIFCDHKIIRGIISQRVIPELCPDCSVPLNANLGVLPRRIVDALSTWGDISRVRLQGDGCATCSYDGTRSRFAVAEVVITTAELMADFVKHGSEVARANYRKRPDADKPMLETAIMHALNGLVDPRAIEDKVDLIEPKAIDIATEHPAFVERRKTNSANAFQMNPAFVERRNINAAK